MKKIKMFGLLEDNELVFDEGSEGNNEDGTPLLFSTQELAEEYRTENELTDCEVVTVTLTVQKMEHA